MKASSLETFTDTVSAIWPVGGTRVIDTTRIALAGLTYADPGEPWLANLRAEKPATRELYRSAEHGFVFLAHTENEGLYRPPHDHGRAWVVYAVQSGEIEIGTYNRVLGPDGETTLVERDRSILRPGEARVYLPGDIHDTRCLTETALEYRFTERDLRHEDLVEGKVTRFEMVDGQWAIGTR